MNIRTARVDDIDRVQQLWEEMTELHVELQPWFTLSEQGNKIHRDFLVQDLDDPAFHIVVAEEEGEVVGYCLAQLQQNLPLFKQESYAHIHDLAVTERYRRKGVGEKLFTAMKQWIGEQGISQIRLQIVASNVLSSSFWPKQGFKEFNRTLFLDLE